MISVVKQIFVIPVLLLFAAGITNSAEDLNAGTVKVGFTSSGHPYKGNPDAPITLVEYSDYLCPFCARHQTNTLPELLDRYVTTGKINIEFRHFPLAVLHPTAHKGHVAAACAGDVSASAFWKYHDALFLNQREWNRLEDPSKYLVALAVNLGVHENNWLSCFKDNSNAELVDDDIASGKSLAFTGTPTFQLISNDSPDKPYTISGARPFNYFKNAIDALLEGGEPPALPESPKPELPVWAKPDALATNPDRPGFTIGGDPTHGNDDAPLVIVEFTDYQCPACAKHFTETQPAIEKQLINTGKVRWVSKHLPLPEHKNSIAAAAAAECAAFQGGFEKMKSMLFEKQPEWAALDNPDALISSIAGDISNLNTADFTNCLNSRQALEGVLTDVFEATRFTRSTPSFVILDGESGSVIRGFSAVERFVDAVNKKLETASEITLRKESS